MFLLRSKVSLAAGRDHGSVSLDHYRSGGFGSAFVMIYASGFATGGIAAGVRLGIMLEILAIGARCAIYATQPFPAKLLVLISIGGFIEMIVTGVIVGAIYKSTAERTS